MTKKHVMKSDAQAAKGAG